MRQRYTGYSHNIVTVRPFLPQGHRYVMQGVRGSIQIKRGTGMLTAPVGLGQVGQIETLAISAVTGVAKLFSGGGAICTSEALHAGRAAQVRNNDFTWVYNYQAIGAAQPGSAPGITFPFPNPVTQDERNANIATYAQTGRGCKEHVASKEWLAINMPRILAAKAARESGVQPPPPSYVSSQTPAPTPTPAMAPTPPSPAGEGVPTWALIGGGAVLLFGIIMAVRR